MQSNIEVALAVKLQKLFAAEDDKFLSFPMGMGFQDDELTFMEDDRGATAEQLQQRNLARAQFARLMNVVPEDQVVAAPDASRFLWDEYKGVLENAELAESILTDNEEKQLKQAEDFLTDVVEHDGESIPVYSDAVKKYYHYKTLSDEVDQLYLDEKITVETSNDGDLQRKWAEFRDAELRQLKEKALNDWINLGFKYDVEKYQEIKSRLSQKTPGLYRQTYLEDFLACNETLDINDPVGTYATFYSPSNCFDITQPWSRITLQKQEIVSLLHSAPAELSRFVTGTDVDIESISLDYHKVVIIRPWFNPDFFTSRYWKLPDSEVVISDGNVPRKGKIPAFITNMIVARNIEVTKKKSAASPSSPLQFSFLTKDLTTVRHHIVAMQGATQVPAPANIKPLLVTTTSKPTVNINSLAVQTARVPLARTATVNVTTSPRANNFVQAKYSGTSVRVLQRPVVRDHRSRSVNESIRIRPRVIDHRATLPPPRHDVPKPAEELIKESLELGGVAVIALVCKRIAKSPNPDSSLTWLS